MGPFLRSKNNTNRLMINLIISLLPIILFSIYKNGFIPYNEGLINFVEIFNPLINILIASLSSLVIESIYAIILKKKSYIKNSYSFFPGLFLALILPINTPIYVIVIGSFIASISKIIFGGFGKNIFNPALIGYLFVTIVFSDILINNKSLVFEIISYDELINFNNFSNLLIIIIPVILSVLIYLFLSFYNIIKWRISLAYILTVFIITLGIGRLLEQDLYYPLFHILSGGLMFAAIFMATDPVTSCVTPVGQIIQGILLGIITVLFRNFGIEGVAYSILIGNAFVAILDKFGMQARFNFVKSSFWFIILGTIVIALTIILANFNKDSIKPSFNMASEENIVINI